MMRIAPWLCRLLLVVLFAATGALGDDKKTVSASIPATNAILEIKGPLVRLSERASESVGIRTEQGTVYTLVSNRMSSALFIDTNLLGKTLVLKGRVMLDRKSFEVTGNLRSQRDGKIHKLYYYCDICSIEGIDPGPCMCCRDPVHLVEE